MSHIVWLGEFRETSFSFGSFSSESSLMYGPYSMVHLRLIIYSSVLTQYGIDNTLWYLYFDYLWFDQYRGSSTWLSREQRLPFSKFVPLKIIFTIQRARHCL